MGSRTSPEVVPSEHVYGGQLARGDSKLNSGNGEFSCVESARSCFRSELCYYCHSVDVAVVKEVRVGDIPGKGLSRKHPAGSQGPVFSRANQGPQRQLKPRASRLTANQRSA